MKFRSAVIAIALSASMMAQMPSAPMASSHSSMAPSTSSTGGLLPMTQDQMASKVAIRINGSELSELDVRREMVTIFPYAMQHNGFPKDIEPQIRKGAVEMIIFEELLYQEAKRLNISVSPDKLAKAQAAFRKQFPTKSGFQQYLKVECKGSEQVLREKVRRSLLIDKMLKNEVNAKAVVTPAMVRAYYDKQGKEFEHGETVDLQTISIVPPQGASKDVVAGAKAKAQEIAKQAKQTKNYEQFGILAENVSDDDWHTHMGDRKTMDVKKLPPMVAKIATTMKVGTVSDLIEVGNAWVIVRLNAHKTAGKTPFAEVQKKLSSDLQKQKTLDVRASLNQKLRKDAKIDVL
jgi:peptidyl-prolyl cis-trans isomerase SurA